MSRETFMSLCLEWTYLNARQFYSFSLLSKLPLQRSCIRAVGPCKLHPTLLTRSDVSYNLSTVGPHSRKTCIKFFQVPQDKGCIDWVTGREQRIAFGAKSACCGSFGERERQEIKRKKEEVEEKEVEEKEEEGRRRRRRGKFLCSL